MKASRSCIAILMIYLHCISFSQLSMGKGISNPSPYPPNTVFWNHFKNRHIHKELKQQNVNAHTRHYNFPQSTADSTPSINLEWVSHASTFDQHCWSWSDGLLFSSREQCLYMLGGVNNPESSADYRLTKFTLSGDTVWDHIFDGECFTDDYAFAFTEDPNGNIIVVGKGRESEAESQQRPLLFLFAPDGTLLWRTLYHTNEQINIGVKGIIVTLNDFVLLCTTQDNDGLKDIMTIKYDHNGNLLWTARYDDINHGQDCANGIVADSAGNIYVSGSVISDRDGTLDFGVIKYNKDGVQEWVRQYGGSSQTDDTQSGISLDNKGILTLAGISQDVGSTNKTLLMVKYSSIGDTIFARSYNLDVWVYNLFGQLSDQHGNIYLVGTDSYDVIAVKIDSTGEKQRTYRFDAGNLEYPESACIDHGGQLLITGASDSSITQRGHDFVLKVSDLGTTLWSSIGFGNAIEGTAITEDSFGYIYVAGNNEDCLLAKYDSNGNEIWDKVVQAPNKSDDIAASIAVDNYRSAYLTGILVTDTSFDYVVSKFNNMGRLRWSTRFSGPSVNGYTGASFTGVDEHHNVYISGSAYFGENPESTPIVKFDSNGVQQWAKYFQAGQGNIIQQMKVTPSGDIYIASFVRITRSNHRMIFANYNTEGNLQWEEYYGDTTATYADVTGMEVDSFGNLYAAGFLIGSRNEGLGLVTSKFDCSGNQCWSFTYNDTTAYSTRSGSLTMDSKGAALYVTAFSNLKTSEQDQVTFKLDTAGNKQWIQHYIMPASTIIPSYGQIIHDDSGQIYVSNYILNSDQGSGLLLLKYNQDGIKNWNKFITLPKGGYSDFTYENGNILLTSSTGSPRLIVIGPDGVIRRTEYFPDSIVASSFLFTISPIGGFYIGTTTTYGSGLELTVLKYSWDKPDTVVGVADPRNFPGNFIIHQNYPNPFNSSTKIYYSIPVMSSVHIEIFNLLGESIASPMNGIQTPGDKILSWDASEFPSGIYFCRIEAIPISVPGMHFTDIKKMLLIR